jgi:hypothetical protein
MKSDGFPNAVALLRSASRSRSPCRYSRPSHSVGCPKRNRAAVSYSLPRARTLAAAISMQTIRMPSAM